MGDFSAAGGVEVENIARWDGHEWSGVGSEIDGAVDALVATGDGLYAGGSFTHAGGVEVNHIAKGDGREWSPLGAGMNGSVFLDGVPPLEAADCRATVFFRDIPAGGYSIERTTDLETWEHMVTRYAGLTGGIDFLDENAPGSEAYYRAVPLNPE